MGVLNWMGQAITKLMAPFVPIQSVFRSIFADPRRLQRPYAELPMVHRCIAEVARNLARVPKRVVEGDPESPTPVANHPFNRVMERPNPYQNGEQFDEQMWGLLEERGACFVVMPDREPGQYPTTMYCLSPESAQAVPDAEGLPVAWKFNVGANGKTVTYPLYQLMQIKYVDHDSVMGWLSPLDVLRRACASTWSAEAWNLAFFEHGADPGGIFTTQQVLNPEIIGEFKADLRDHNQGAGNRGQPLVLHGGMGYQPFPVSHRDMDFIGQLERDDMLVCAVYRVPPEVVGFKTATFENQATARKAFWKHSLDPRMAMAEAMYWNLFELGPDMGRTWVEYDRNSVQDLQDDLDGKLTQASALQALGYSMNEVNDRLKLGMKNRPEGDRRLVSAGLQPLSDVGMGPEYGQMGNGPAPLYMPKKKPMGEVGPGPGQPQVGGGRPQAQVTGGGAGSPFPLLGPGTGTAGSSLRVDSVGAGAGGLRALEPTYVDVSVGEADEYRHFASHYGLVVKGATRHAAARFDKNLRAIERDFESKVTRHFMDLRAMTLKAVTAAFGLKSAAELRVITKAAGGDDLWGGEWPRAKAKLVRVVSPLYQAAAREGIDEVLEEMGVGGWEGQWDVPPAVMDALTKRRKGIDDIDDTMRAAVQQAIGDALRDGNITDVQTAVRDIFNAGASRALTIARTEVMGAANQARFHQMREVGAQYHEWLTAGDEVVRSSHKDAADQGPVPLGQPFSNGLLYPGDPDADDPGEVINCRCRTVAVFTD